MLLTPRTYSLAQIPDAGCREARTSYFLLTPSRKERYLEEQRARKMLLLHQTGSVKVGEVVRYAPFELRFEAYIYIILLTVPVIR